MSNNNLLGVHAEVAEVAEVGIMLFSEEELGARETAERDAMDRVTKTVREIHEEGREDQKYWLEFSRWMMYDSEHIPQEIKWGLELHKWSADAPRTTPEYWDKIADWFPEEEIPREIRWGIAWNRWRTDFVDDLKKLRDCLKREANHESV